MREGTGWGCATARTAASAHERALKSAETDATKRALSTFGPRFGLNLYDKDSNNGGAFSNPVLTLFASDGRVIAGNISPERFSTGLRQLIEFCGNSQEVESLRANNGASIAKLKSLAPSLRNAQGTHFADLLLKLLERGMERLNSGNPGKSQLDEAEPQTKDFRRYVGQAEPRKVRIIPKAVHGDAGDGAQPPSGPPHAPRIGVPDLQSEPTPPVEEPADPLNLKSLALVNLQERSAFAKNSEHRLLDSPDKKRPTKDVLSILGADNTPPPLAPSRIALGPRIDKALLTIGFERRFRDKDHLRRVAQLPCLVCSRQPSHAHHLRFAQRRGLSQKVSDEYVVPLCALHHGDLHRSASEKDWWLKQNIDPIPVSSQLWETRQ